MKKFYKLGGTVTCTSRLVRNGGVTLPFDLLPTSRIRILLSVLEIRHSVIKDVDKINSLVEKDRYLTTSEIFQTVNITILLQLRKVEIGINFNTSVPQDLRKEIQ